MAAPRGNACQKSCAREPKFPQSFGGWTRVGLLVPAARQARRPEAGTWSARMGTNESMWKSIIVRDDRTRADEEMR